MTELDHLVLATPDLESTVDWVSQALGVRPGPGGQHLGVGTRNFLLGLGPGRYLEIMGPDSDQPEPPRPRPFGIDGLDRPTLAAWVARSAALEELTAGAARHGYDLGPIEEMSRTTPEGRVLRWRLTRRHPAGVTVVPLVIDWGDTEHPSATAPAGVSLVSFRAVHPEPDPVKKVLAALGLDLEVSTGPEPRLIAELTGPSGSLQLP